MFLILDIGARFRHPVLDALLALAVGLITALCTRARAVLRERRTSD
jgi:hypothetical protein